MGLLAAVEGLPWLLVGLPAGVWVDRLPRKQVLVATDLGRGLLIGVVPVLVIGGWLRIGSRPTAASRRRAPPPR
jgi:hypothetical protein